mmetsp:Transcript_10104/g.23301  ORF Transcript_10104/g.23301 Transcript_10104/m.23301 type:complete len:519 (+) Transcript_10104:72-1628(+)
MKSSLRLVAASLAAIHQALAVFVSPWSTEPLSWSGPNNVTIQTFDTRPLAFPLPYSVMIRVYNSEECKAVDSDKGRGMWWAEVRRHTPSEAALALANVAQAQLPAPSGAKGTSEGVSRLQVTSGCSTIAFVRAGLDPLEELAFGSKSKDEVKVAPLDSEGMPAFVRWSQTALKVTCLVKNPLKEELTLYWVDESTEERRLLDAPCCGALIPQSTTVGHIFVARNKRTGRVVDWWAMTGASEHVIEDRAGLLELASCQAPNTPTTLYSPADHPGENAKGGAEAVDGAAVGESLEGECLSGERALFDFLYDSSMAKRYALNTVQPTIVHNYTALGYAVLPLPAATYGWLKKWYEQNAKSEILEDSAGAVGTQHTAPWYVRHIPWPLKQRLISELLPILAEWSGFDARELEMTSIYGIRRYSRGSVLRMHVDTVVTHVVSAIVNVDQLPADGNSTELDWPLEFKTNSGEFHYVNMRPGEMLLYESAKCLHGRPQPFGGEAYANIFLHFKPTAPGSWEYGWY